jgi:sugar lactone lactonase YvrE
MKLVGLLLMAYTWAPSASAQYTISTIAGGGPRNGVASTSVGLGTLGGVAVDAAGNVYFASSLQSRVYKSTPAGVLTTVAGTGGNGYSGDNGPAVAAQLNQPAGVALDSSGNLYIADAVNSRIRMVTPGGIITTVAGNGAYGYFGDNGLATDAWLSGPRGVAIDDSNNLLIADSSNNRIRKVVGGIITTIAGNGSGGYSGDNSLAISAQLNFPSGVAFSNGSLYIADTFNFRVRKVTGGTITTIAGTGSFGSTGDNGPAVNAQLTSIAGIASDSAGSIYIAEGAGQRIRKIAGGTITTVAGGGAGCAGQTSPYGDGCAPTSAILLGPAGVALDAAGRLFITEGTGYRVRKVANGVTSTVAGNGSFQYSGDGGAATDAQLSPRGIAVQSPGKFWVADSDNYRVRKVSGGLVTTEAGNGNCCYSGENVTANGASIDFAFDIAADTLGNFVTAEQTRIRRDSGGILNTVAGTGVMGFSGDNGPALGAQLSGASGVAIDAAGNVYFSDTMNNRVRKVSAGVVTTVAGGGPLDGATATNVSFDQIVAVAADAAGNLYFPSATDHKVYRVSTAGALTTVAGNGSPGYSGDNGPAAAAQLNSPYGVAVNSAGTVVYIADRGNHRVRAVTGGNISTVAGGGTGCPQQTNTEGDDCAGTNARLSAPAMLALDSTGTVLYIADSLHYRVRKLTAGIITTVAGDGTCCFSGDGGPATSAQLNYATGVAINPVNGDLYIGDSENFRVRKVSGGTITTVAGNGSFGYSGDTGFATNAQLSYPYGIALDSTGDLYIADSANHRIRKVSGGAIVTIAGTGTPGYAGDNGSPANAQIYTPYGVAVDGSGALYIADTRNFRVRKIAGGTMTTVAGNGELSFSGDGGQAVGAQLYRPSAIAVEGGALYIADNGNARIRKVSAGGLISTVAGNGICCNSGENVPATGPIGNVTGIAADGLGNFYFSDQSNAAVRKVTAGSIVTIAGNYSYGYNGDGFPATFASLSNPQGLAIDSAGNLYIADAGNGRVRLLTTTPKVVAAIAPLSVAAGAAGFTLQVNGSGFASGDVVQWNGIDLATTFVNAGQLTATVPAGQVLQPGIAVITVNGLSNSLTFTVSPPPSLSIAKTHAGNFTQGQSGAAFLVTVSNAAGTGATSGTVTVTENVPPGLTLLSMSGVGWTCAGASCTRADALPGGSSYPPITVRVAVSAAATSPQINAVSVFGGGSAIAGAVDSATILPAFTDAASTDFFYDAVNLMRQYGITGGCSVNPPMYCPGDPVTRAQMAIFIVRAVLGGDNFTYSATPYFTDVPVNAFGFKWIQKMKELNITAGCGNNNYCPDDSVTRGQMAIFVIRARLGAPADASFTYPSSPYFTDVNAGHPFFKWIQRMKLDQITAGCGDGSTYCPDAPVTRGQMAIFIMRGAFNQLLPAGTPVIVAVNPAIAPVGQGTAVTLTGINTNFAQGTTQVSAGPGVTTGTISVINATTLSVQLIVAGNAAPGPRTLVVTTGAEQAVVPNGLTVP